MKSARFARTPDPPAPSPGDRPARRRRRDGPEPAPQRQTAPGHARRAEARGQRAAGSAWRAEYLERARAAARRLVRQGFLLEEDVDRVVERAGERWDWMEERAEGGGG